MRKIRFVPNNISMRILWVILFLIFGFCLRYFQSRMSDQNFSDSIISNFIATSLGAIVGIPIGLFINDSNNRVEKQQREDIRKEKEQNILKLIGLELEENLSIIPKRKRDNFASIEFPFKTEVYEAFALSGELKWIDNPDIIHSLADSYHIIKHVKELENLGIKLRKSAINSSDNVIIAGNDILNKARSFDNNLSKKINSTLKDIN